MGLVDEEDGWDGSNYDAEHVYGIEYMVATLLGGTSRRRGGERGAETGNGDRRGVPADEFWVWQAGVVVEEA